MIFRIRVFWTVLKQQETRVWNNEEKYTRSLRWTLGRQSKARLGQTLQLRRQHST